MFNNIAYHHHFSSYSFTIMHVIVCYFILWILLVNCNIRFCHFPVEEMRHKAEGLLLPRPTLLHHIVEDFLTFWMCPHTHVLPLRRFLENCLRADLRTFFSHTCMQLAMTRIRVPLYCQAFEHYLNLERGGLENPSLNMQAGIKNDVTVTDR